MDAGLNLSRVLESQEDFPSSALPGQHGNATKHPADVREEGKTALTLFFLQLGYCEEKRRSKERRAGAVSVWWHHSGQREQLLRAADTHLVTWVPRPLPHVWGV